MNRPGWFLVALLAIGVGLAGQSSLLGQSQKPDKPATGMIAGQVVDAGSTRPVEEAVVTLNGAGLSRRVMVDERGRFVFTNLRAGRYELESDQFGYVSGSFGRRRPDGRSQRVELADGQRVLDATIMMWRYASITGRVLDEFGEPMARITVRALRHTISAGQLTLSPSGLPSTGTDDRGVYRLAKLTPGDYAIAVPAQLSTFPVDVLRHALTSNISLGVGETARLGDSRYLQIGDHVIATMSAAPVPPAPKTGERLTVFRTTYYPAASLATEATTMTLSAGEEVVGIDIRMAAVPTVSISGKVTGPYGPVASAPFQLVRAGDDGAAETFDSHAATGVTNVAGQFTVLGVPRGRYEIRLRVGETATTGANPTAKTPLVARDLINVGDTDLTDINVTARPMAALRGRIEFKAPMPTGANPFLVIAQAFDPGPQRVDNPRVDKSGYFSSRLLPGRYLLSAYAGDARCGSVVVNGKEVGDALVPVETEVLEVVFRCGAAPATATLTGRVRDESRRDDPQSQVVIFPTDRTQWSGEGYRPLRVSSSSTTAAATFSILDIAPGEYFVAAIPEAAGGSWRHPRILESLARLAARVTLVAGDKHTINLTTVAVR